MLSSVKHDQKLHDSFDVYCHITLQTRLWGVRLSTFAFTLNDFLLIYMICISLNLNPADQEKCFNSTDFCSLIGCFIFPHLLIINYDLFVFTFHNFIFNSFATKRDSSRAGRLYRSLPSATIVALMFYI